MKHKPQLTIFCVEDHNEIRNGIMYMLGTRADYTCSAYKNGTEVLAAVNETKPDVILMDINLPDISGIECTRRIKDQFPDVLIMMFTVLEDSDKIFEALKAGASGYLLKNNGGAELFEAIDELIKGGAPMSSVIARKVVSSFSTPAANVPINTEYTALTKKETEILQLLAKGFSNKEIANQLFVSVNTIKTHVYRIYEKLHVRNKMEAVNKLKQTVLRD